MNRKWTGNEHEMNMKWTWNEREMNMKWTWIEHEMSPMHKNIKELLKVKVMGKDYVRINQDYNPWIDLNQECSSLGLKVKTLHKTCTWHCTLYIHMWSFQATFVA